MGAGTMRKTSCSGVYGRSGALERGEVLPRPQVAARGDVDILPGDLAETYGEAGEARSEDSSDHAAMRRLNESAEKSTSLSSLLLTSAFTEGLLL